LFGRPEIQSVNSKSRKNPLDRQEVHVDMRLVDSDLPTCHRCCGIVPTVIGRSIF
jgi:hypothetical protein